MSPAANQTDTLVEPATRPVNVPAMIIQQLPPPDADYISSTKGLIHRYMLRVLDRHYNFDTTEQ